MHCKHEILFVFQIVLFQIALAVVKKKDYGIDSEKDLKSHCSGDFLFQIIDMNDFDFKITQTW